jgi:hypothetical protein
VGRLPQPDNLTAKTAKIAESRQLSSPDLLDHPKYFTAKLAEIAKSRQLSSSRKNVRTELFRIVPTGIAPPLS